MRNAGPPYFEALVWDGNHLDLTGGVLTQTATLPCSVTINVTPASATTAMVFDWKGIFTEPGGTRHSFSGCGYSSLAGADSIAIALANNEVLFYNFDMNLQVYGMLK